MLADIEKAKEEAEDVVSIQNNVYVFLLRVTNHSISYLEQMELEIRGLDAGSAERDRRLNQWQSHRVELRRLVAQVERTKKGISAKRNRKSLGLDDDDCEFPTDVASLTGGGGGGGGER